MDGSASLLTSYSGHYAWEVGENEARCVQSPIDKVHPQDAAPIHWCACGFWAFDKLESLLESAELSVLFLGEIEAHGRVQLHERGFRAQFARVKRLYVPEIRGGFLSLSKRQEVAIHAASVYGVPLATMRMPAGWCVANTWETEEIRAFQSTYPVRYIRTETSKFERVAG